MEVFGFYIVAMLAVFTVLAAIADGIGHFRPDWYAEDDELLEDASPRGEREL